MARDTADTLGRLRMLGMCLPAQTLRQRMLVHHDGALISNAQATGQQKKLPVHMYFFGSFRTCTALHMSGQIAEATVHHPCRGTAKALMKPLEPNWNMI